MSETWNKSESDVISLPSYSSFYLNRSSKCGGGVAFLVKPYMKYKIFGEFSGTFSNTEDLTIRHSNLLFSVSCHSPQGNRGDFLDYFENLNFCAADSSFSHSLVATLTLICPQIKFQKYNLLQSWKLPVFATIYFANSCYTLLIDGSWPYTYI